MNTFANAVATEQNQTTTTNGMAAFVSTTNANVDFFFKAAASRGKDITVMFAAAYEENPELAIRNLLWLRDARGGAGERELYRQVLRYLEQTNDEALLTKLIARTPEIGRFDDILVFKTEKYKAIAFALIKSELEKGNGLVAKWLPRKAKPQKGDLVAIELRRYLGLTPKQYRKLIVDGTNVVETAMCAKKWTAIEFAHVPSLAATRYNKAFIRNAEGPYKEYVNALVKGEAKVNTAGLFPYDITKNVRNTLDVTGAAFLQAQWDALPNYVGDAKILPIIDVSGSMSISVGTDPKIRGRGPALTCMDVAISLGMYLSDKNQGAFHGVYMTFSMSPQLIKSTGSLRQRYNQIGGSAWGMNTNIAATFEEILNFAQRNRVAPADMPEYLVILSDMQFDVASGDRTSAFKYAEKLFENTGYKMPKIIFWNIRAYDNVPVRFDQQGSALVSGFSPSIVQAVLSADLDKAKTITPLEVMLEAIMKDRYEL